MSDKDTSFTANPHALPILLLTADIQSGTQKCRDRLEHYRLNYRHRAENGSTVYGCTSLRYVYELVGVSKQNSFPGISLVVKVEGGCLNS
jgi:hypothetical protein